MTHYHTDRLTNPLWLIAAAFSIISFMTGCRQQPAVPASYTLSDEKPLMFPDYTDITCPWNIAPLNFQIMNPGQACVAEIRGDRFSIIASSGKDGKVRFDLGTWRSVLESHKGQTLIAHLYVEDKDGNWRRLKPYALHVAPEPIDSFLTYRLIEPGYVAFKNMGIYQRDLTTFQIRTLYEGEENHCINCHNYQQNRTGRMMLHVRGNHAGTLIGEQGKLRKIKTPATIPYGTTYPAWHPTRPWLAFSSNSTRQSFHINHPEKVEVQDLASDLIFYDTEKEHISYILHTDSVLETFPHWSPDGRRLYYTAARVDSMAGLSQEDREMYVLSHYRELRYDIMYMDFNPTTQTFGTPRKLVPCAAQGKSASVVRISPDGRYLLCTLADYGQFHIWHKNADLYACDLQTAQPVPYPLDEANSKEADSYHSWSSNGRWIAFSSRRDDGNYTRTYIAYFGKDGKARKAFMLPQEDPEDNILRLKSYNVPELTCNPVPFSREEMEQAVNEMEAKDVKHVTSSANY